MLGSTRLCVIMPLISDIALSMDATASCVPLLITPALVTSSGLVVGAVNTSRWADGLLAAAEVSVVVGVVTTGVAAGTGVTGAGVTGAGVAGNSGVLEGRSSKPVVLAGSKE